MVFKCCVPACRGNYDEQNKVAVFSFPKEEDLKKVWINSIPRQDFVWTKNLRVCEKHFKADDIVRETSAFDEVKGVLITVALQRPHLKPGAVPCIFPGCPSYLSSSCTSLSRPSPAEKRILRDQQNISYAIKESEKAHEAYVSKRCFSNLDELLKCENLKCSTFWDVVMKDNCLLYLHLNVEDGVNLIYTVIIDSNLKLSVYFKGKAIPAISSKFSFPMHVTNVNDIHDILLCIENYDFQNIVCENDASICIDLSRHFLKLARNFLVEKDDQIDFLDEQLKLLPCKPQKYAYSSLMLVLSTMFYLISPQGYRFVRDMKILTLPHPSTIHKVSSQYQSDPSVELNSTFFLSYIKSKVVGLKQQDFFVSLMMDEIHIKPFIDYKSGNIVGTAFEDDKLASTAFVFMIQSILSSNKEVVHILPTKKIDADIIHKVLKETIIGLEGLGFSVIGVSSDNNSINRKSVHLFNNPLADFVFQHPVNPLRPLFYVVDTVHLIKCVRNNWINQKNNEQAFYYPDFDLKSNKVYTASFLSVKKLYEIENGKMMKHAYKLSQKALWPNNLEKQNVKLALQVFDSSTVKGLREFGSDDSNLNFNSTASLIDIFHTWFSIVNVKTPYKGKHSRNVMCEPLRLDENDPKLIFLYNFVDWLKKWSDMESDTGRLTRETNSALILSTTSIIELTKYCIKELNMSYLLPGKFQTDELEYRFSLYRRLAGSNYNISLRQVYEIEKKIRVCSVLKLKLKSHSKGEIPISHFFTDEDSISDNNQLQNNEFVDIEVTDNDLNNLKDTIVLIAYLAGYCVHSVCGRLKCDMCTSNLTTDRELSNDPVFRLIRQCDRGGLKYPIPEMILIVACNYIVLQKMISDKYEKLFLNLSNQKSVVYTVTLNVLAQRDVIVSVCENHNSSIVKMVLSSATNTLIKNYCRNKSEILKNNSKDAKQKNKRKLSTLKGST